MSLYDCNERSLCGFSQDVETKEYYLSLHMVHLKVLIMTDTEG